MSMDVLSQFMKRNGLTEVDVAAAVKCNPVTVSRFLKGTKVSRMTLAALERFVQDYSKAKKAK